MFVSGLPPILRRTVYLVQSFSWCRVTHDTWKSCQCRAFNRKPEEFDKDGVKKPRPKTEPVPKITLMAPNNSITITVLEEAQRLAKRRNLTLVKVSDPETKSQRAVYKLVDNTNVLEEFKEVVKSADKTETQKDTKLLYISGNIAEHDLQTKTKNVVRLLNKGNKVKIIIFLDGANGDKLQRVIKDAVKNDGSVQQMPSKKNVVSLVIKPLLKNEDISVNNKNEIDNSNS